MLVTNHNLLKFQILSQLLKPQADDGIQTQDISLTKSPACPAPLELHTNAGRKNV